MDTADKVTAVNKYVEAFANSDIDIIKQLYASDAIVEDPVGTDSYEGIEAIVAFYTTGLAAGAKLELTGPVRCAGNTAAFPFVCKVGDMSINIIDVFEFNDAGKVTSMKAYWGPENFS
ncbi:MAG: steroid delta-isomerase [Pseudomonadales bacterium]